MTARKPIHVEPDQLEAALELYYAKRVDLPGLCQLMAALGANPGQDPTRLAHRMALLVHERMTVQARADASVATGDAPVADTSPNDDGEGNANETRALPNAARAAIDADGRPTGIGRPGAVRIQDEPNPSMAEVRAESHATVQVAKASGRQSGAFYKAVVKSGSPRETTPLQGFCTNSGVTPRVGPPGLSSEAPPVDAPGDIHYAWGGELGMGGVGRVNVAVDRDLKRTVAIKTLRDTSRSDSVQVQAFIEEAIVTGGLVHPNIVPVYALGYNEDQGPYYAMKRLTGEPLSSILRRIARQDAQTMQSFGLFRLLECFQHICRAIAFAHAKGVIHCDLKPSNVVVGDFGEVTVVDWGLARVLGEGGRGQARALLTSGTPAYMPPEQATGTIRDLDEQSDIWSLGAMLYEILSLTVPFDAETSEQTIIRLLADPVEPPSKRAPDRLIPPSLEQICMRALNKDKLARYPSVNDLLHELQDYLEGTRERRRREETADHAVEQVRAALERLGSAEATADARQEAILVGPAEVRAQFDSRLEDARDDLVFGYTDALHALARGLDAIDDHPVLLELVGDLYWRVFGRLYPGRVPPSELVREQGMALLAQISQLSLAAVVKAGRKHAAVPSQSSLSNAATEDPWLDAVLSFCGTALEFDATRAPDAMVPLVRRIAFLKGVSLFDGMVGSDLLPIAEACERQDFAEGTTIFSQGDRGDALYVVMSGSVGIVIDGTVVNTLGPTDCFGEIAVLDEAPRTAGTACVGPVSVLRLTAGRFRKIVREQGEIGLSVIRVLTERLRQATDREKSLRHTIDT